NWPNAKKVAGGRSRDPQLVRVVKFDGGRTSLQALSDALPKGVTKTQPKGTKTQASTADVHKPGSEKGRSPHRAAVEGTPENQDALQRMLSLPPDLQTEIKQPVPAGNRSTAI